MIERLTQQIAESKEATEREIKKRLLTQHELDELQMEMQLMRLGLDDLQRENEKLRTHDPQHSYIAASSAGALYIASRTHPMPELFYIITTHVFGRPHERLRIRTR